MNAIRHAVSFVIGKSICYKRHRERRYPRGLGIYSIDPQAIVLKRPCCVCSHRPAGARTILLAVVVVLMITACAGLGQRSALPSCSNVRGYFHSDVPLGAERIGSRLWIERRLIFSSQIGPVIRAVAAGYADGEWEATRMRTPLLVEDGLWKTTVPTGIANQYPYDVNFDARAWPEPRFTTARIARRTVEIHLHAFGPHLGNYGLERTIRMAALKFRGAPDTDWAICPVRL